MVEGVVLVADFGAGECSPHEGCVLLVIYLRAFAHYKYYTHNHQYQPSISASTTLAVSSCWSILKGGYGWMSILIRETVGFDQKFLR